MNTDLQPSVELLKALEPGTALSPAAVEHLRTVIRVFEQVTQGQPSQVLVVTDGSVDPATGLRGFVVSYREGSDLRDVVLAWLAATQSLMTILEAHGAVTAANNLRNAVKQLNLGVEVVHRNGPRSRGSGEIH
jgi:hypothetical protein